MKIELTEKEQRIQDRYMKRKKNRSKAVKRSPFCQGKRKAPWSFYEEGGEYENS